MTYTIREKSLRIGDQFCVRWPVWPAGKYSQWPVNVRPVCYEILYGEVIAIGKVRYTVLLDTGKTKQMNMMKLANLCAFRKLREGERDTRQIVPD